VLFPEGTTTRGDTVQNFHGRLLQPAISANVPVQAVAIDYQGIAKSMVAFVGEDEFLPNLLSVLSLANIEVTVSFCEPFSVSDGSRRNELARRARSQVLEELGLTEDVERIGVRSGQA
jgi:1-acyl-sn-glycerol-3-phosphate acyltransferase